MGKRYVRSWAGEPGFCDCCSLALVGGIGLDDGRDEFIDGRTVMGPWAKMCIPCHRKIGTGLGTGSGQHYKFSRDSQEWEKIDG